MKTFALVAGIAGILSFAAPAAVDTARADPASAMKACMAYGNACCQASIRKYGPPGSADGGARRARIAELEACARSTQKLTGIQVRPEPGNLRATARLPRSAQGLDS